MKHLIWTRGPEDDSVESKHVAPLSHYVLVLPLLCLTELHPPFILGGSVHTIKENRNTLLVASKEIGIEVNADKTKYMVMSGDQNAG